MAILYVTDRDGEEYQVDGQVGFKIMETLRELDYGVEALCGGMCSCATCHVYIAEAWYQKLPEPESEELELLEELDAYQDNSRLTCQIEFKRELDGLRLTIAPEE